MGEDVTQLRLVVDVVQRRPACVLLQAAYGMGARPRALRYFDAADWLTVPTPDMRIVTGTDDEWRALAQQCAQRRSKA